MRECPKCVEEAAIEPKYSEIEMDIDLDGPEGNAFHIISMAKKSMVEIGVSSAEIKEFVKDAMSGDYDHVKHTIEKWVGVEWYHAEQRMD